MNINEEEKIKQHLLMLIWYSKTISRAVEEKNDRSHPQLVVAETILDFFLHHKNFIGFMNFKQFTMLYKLLPPLKICKKLLNKYKKQFPRFQFDWLDTEELFQKGELVEVGYLRKTGVVAESTSFDCFSRFYLLFLLDGEGNKNFRVMRDCFFSRV